MIVKLIEIINELLIALNSEMFFHLLHVFDLLLIARQLLLHLGHHFVAGFISLFDIVVSTVKLFCLILHISY